ncbi:hypothetical protein HY837_05605 [archaeon]|nr:hypothetical protein [archaeon]
MEQVKKRHNPPIFETDLAVKAFDSSVQPRSDPPLTIDQAVEKEEVNFEVSEEGLKQEFENLIRRVYGFVFKKAKKIEGAFFCEHDPFYVVRGYKCSSGGFFSQDGVVILPSNIKKRRINAGGSYQPITISVYNAKFWKQSQTFAKAYEHISGQKATLVKEFHEEEAKDKELEKIITSEESEGLIEEELPEGVKVSRDGNEEKKEAQKKFKNMLSTLLTDKYLVKRTLWDRDEGINGKYRTFNVYARKSFLGLKLDVKVATIEKTFYWDILDSSPLTIMVYNPKELIQMSQFAKRYQEKTRQTVNIIKKY